VLTQLIPLWDELFPAEQARMMQLLMTREELGLALRGGDAWPGYRSRCRRDPGARAAGPMIAMQ
jgi:hypothetical protein